ncbi:MAG: 2Fe-2S iron-sulfur cluster binding domain-containing protein, partial [candidate division Zixibacteria bacterium]|nr:2Fe-2S iron-sulfur cluster binding domain-containing protein [candidate division Zixibacteria bacterium]
MKPHNVDFEPVGRRGKCRDDESLLDCARRLGVGIISLCGGLGKSCCCKIQILGGSTSKPTASERDCFSPEEIKNGYRLACQTYIISDCKVRIPLESLSTPQRTQVEGKEIKVDRKPAVSCYR